MSYTLRLPEINAATDREKLQQIKSYLYQMTQELNMALETVDREQAQFLKNAKESVSSAVKESTSPLKTFAGIRDLIIKNADFVAEFSQKLSLELSKAYVAKADIGTYVEEGTAELSATADALTQNYNKQQEIITDLQTAIVQLDTTAFIKTGQIDEEDGVPIYGVAIGQVTKDEDGNEVYNAAAKFKPSGLELFDSTDAEKPVATFKNDQMTVNNAVVTGSLTVAGLKFEKVANGNYRLSLQ